MYIGRIGLKIFFCIRFRLVGGLSMMVGMIRCLCLVCVGLILVSLIIGMLWVWVCFRYLCRCWYWLVWMIWV